MSGQLVEQWPITTLGEIATIKSGSGFPVKFQGNQREQFPFYKVGDMNNEGNEVRMENSNHTISEEIRRKLKAKIFPAGSIIFPKVGGAIRTNKKRIIVKECCVDNNVMGLIPNEEKILSAYLFYFMTSVDLFEFSNKAALPSIRQSTVSEWEIPVPSLEEQQRIVGILDEAFEQISNSLNHNEFNLKSASSIMSRGIDHEFLNKDTWIEQQFGDVCNFVRGPFGGSLKKAFFVDNGYAVYEQSHAIYDQFETVRYFIGDEKFSEMQRFELKSGDLIMSCSGTIGKIAIVPDGIKPGIINQALLKLTPNESILPEFLKYWMKSMDFQAAIKLHSGGAAIQNVASVKILKQITIHLPSLETQKEIIEKLNLLTHASQELEGLFHEKKEATTELKQSILQEAFNGTLRIAEGLADQS